jgi:hypothetical protein
MTLIPIEHEYRLKSAAEAERFFRALHFFGRASVTVRGHRTTDPDRIARLVAAIEPKREHTIWFEHGKLDVAAFEALAKARFEYLDIATRDASYRSWPNLPRTWVHPSSGDLETLDFEAIPPAIEKFREVMDHDLRRGFISGVDERTKPVLVDFLQRSASTVHVVLHIDIETARALAELHMGERFDWGDARLFVDFFGGRIHGYLVTPNVGPDHQARWQRRVRKALSKANLVDPERSE